MKNSLCLYTHTVSAHTSLRWVCTPALIRVAKTHYSFVSSQATRQKQLMLLRFTAFQERLDDDQFHSSKEVLKKLQSFMVSAISIRDQSILQEATDRFKKYEQICKICDNETALAYARSHFGNNNEFSASEIIELLQTANRCRKAARNNSRRRDSSSSSSSSSSPERHSRRRAKNDRKHNKHDSKKTSNNSGFVPKCFYCGITGHVAPECRRKQADSYNRRNVDNKANAGKGCFICREMGHQAKNCPNSKPDKSNK